MTADWRTGRAMDDPETGFPDHRPAAVREGLSLRPQAAKGEACRLQVLISVGAALSRIGIGAPMLFRPVLVEMGKRPCLVRRQPPFGKGKRQNGRPRQRRHRMETCKLDR